MKTPINNEIEDFSTPLKRQTIENLESMNHNIFYEFNDPDLTPQDINELRSTYREKSWSFGVWFLITAIFLTLLALTALNGNNPY